MSSPIEYDVVVPTIGRPSLHRALRSLADQHQWPSHVVVVDDRASDGPALPIPNALRERCSVSVVTAGGRGPAGARNLGWQLGGSSWVVFLDDDVEVGPAWAAALQADLAAAGPRVAGVQAVVRVPLPARRPTDWERNTAALADGRWITAEMAFRRTALHEVAGFDERFRRAYREDSDLALRLQDAGWSLRRGSRVVTHPVRPADTWVSVRMQRGNADDALMSAVHGRDWRRRAVAGRGRLRAHTLTVALGSLAVGSAAVPGARGRRLALLCGAGWAAATADFAMRRILPGPRTPGEVTAMAVTSVLIPWCAVLHRLRGRLRHRGARRWGPADGDATVASQSAAAS
ncbi:glycosyltransferase [Flexivirga sp. ID2601S]|uniref:Glycosyltransferase n=1 Tax=Flexivirga aerilata TaxID=1656889 RepID=A0A849ARY1_9MICO|nr:glycosyltransferase [Flexivirga aerilata]NNG41040.1 glycosyltransferase [Flexivirga aerilata]